MPIIACISSGLKRSIMVSMLDRAIVRYGHLNAHSRMQTAALAWGTVVQLPPACLSRPSHATSYSAAQNGCKRQRVVQCSASTPGEQLAQEFSRFANEADLQDPLKVRRPSHLLPPTAVVAAQLDALQRNDWPDQDAGIRTAFLFAKPQECENMVTSPSMPNHVRSWEAKEAWVGFPEFSGMLHSGLYQPLLDSSSWQAASPMLFPSSRMTHKAVQAVHVQRQDSNPIPLAFTFCLERIDTGPYKGCWLTVGVRVGNYAVD